MILNRLIYQPTKQATKQATMNFESANRLNVAAARFNARLTEAAADADAIRAFAIASRVLDHFPSPKDYEDTPAGHLTMIRKRKAFDKICTRKQKVLCNARYGLSIHATSLPKKLKSKLRRDIQRMTR